MYVNMYMYICNNIGFHDILYKSELNGTLLTICVCKLLRKTHYLFEMRFK